jgi:hypothetical protein
MGSRIGEVSACLRRNNHSIFTLHGKEGEQALSLRPIDPQLEDIFNIQSASMQGLRHPPEAITVDVRSIWRENQEREAPHEEISRSLDGYYWQPVLFSESKNWRNADNTGLDR